MTNYEYSCKNSELIFHGFHGFLIILQIVTRTFCISIPVDDIINAPNYKFWNLKHDSADLFLPTCLFISQQVSQLPSQLGRYCRRLERYGRLLLAMDRSIDRDMAYLTPLHFLLICCTLHNL